MIHTSIDGVRPALEACAVQPDLDAHAAPYAAAPKKRRWPIYLGIFLAVGAVGNLIERKPIDSYPALSATVQASPSPSLAPASKTAKHSPSKKPKAVPTANSEPVIISEAIQDGASRPARVISTAPPADSLRTRSRSSSGRSYITGPRGGCYYISGSGSKVYVDHSYCY